jgi:hypothetical protein
MQGEGLSAASSNVIAASFLFQAHSRGRGYEKIRQIKMHAVNVAWAKSNSEELVQAVGGPLILSILHICSVLGSGVAMGTQSGLALALTEFAL